MAISVPWRRLTLRPVSLLLWGISSVRRSPDHHPSRSLFARYATAIGCGHQTLVAPLTHSSSSATLSALFYLLTNSDQLLYGSWPPSPTALEILALAGVSPRLGHLTHPGPPVVQASPPSSEGVDDLFEMSARVSLQAGLVRNNNVSSMVD